MPLWMIWLRCPGLELCANGGCNGFEIEGCADPIPDKAPRLSAHTPRGAMFLQEGERGVLPEEFDECAGVLFGVSPWATYRHEARTPFSRVGAQNAPPVGNDGGGFVEVVWRGVATSVARSSTLL